VKISKRNKERLFCALLLSSGMGVCVASIWFPPLIVLGGGLLAGGLGIAANILQDKDRIVINNYNQLGSIMNDSTRPIKRAYSFSKAKLGAIFAFGNKRYAQHHHDQEVKTASDSQTDNLPNHAVDHNALPPEILQDLSRLNELLNKIDMQAIQRMAEKYNQMNVEAGQEDVSRPS
jgi:hypothetical protein